MENWLPMIIQLLATGAIALGIITWFNKLIKSIKDDVMTYAMKLDRIMEKYLGDENADKILDSASGLLKTFQDAVVKMKETDSFQESSDGDNK